MNKNEYIKTVEECEIKKDRVWAIEKIYAVKLEPILEKIVSCADSVDFFDEERRALSYSEIFNPAKNIGFDFIKQGMIPFVDLYDNSYAVFDIATNEWGRFNTVDGVLYKRRKFMKEVL